MAQFEYSKRLIQNQLESIARQAASEKTHLNELGQKQKEAEIRLRNFEEQAEELKALLKTL